MSVKRDSKKDRGLHANDWRRFCPIFALPLIVAVGYIQETFIDYASSASVDAHTSIFTRLSCLYYKLVLFVHDFPLFLLFGGQLHFGLNLWLVVFLHSFDLLVQDLLLRLSQKILTITHSLPVEISCFISYLLDYGLLLQNVLFSLLNRCFKLFIEFRFLS